MKIKKLIAAGLTATMVVGMLTACGAEAAKAAEVRRKVMD